MHEYALKQITVLYLTSFNSKIQHCIYYENVLQTLHTLYLLLNKYVFHWFYISFPFIVLEFGTHCYYFCHTDLFFVFSNCPYLLKFTLLFAQTFDRILRNNVSLKKKVSIWVVIRVEHKTRVGCCVMLFTPTVFLSEWTIISRLNENQMTWTTQEGRAVAMREYRPLLDEKQTVALQPYPSLQLMPLLHLTHNLTP